MRTLIKKEIRLLLPAWIAAMLLAVVSPWIFPASFAGQHPVIPLFYFIFFLGVLFLGITSFGVEFSSGTFAISLSQPTDRRLIWKAKTTTLFIAFFAVWIAAVVSFLWRFNIISVSGEVNIIQRFDWQNYKFISLEIITLSALAAFSGGLWTTLLLRQMTGAFWIALLTPLTVQGGIEILLGMWIIPDWILNTVVIVALTSYSIAGFFVARWLFFHAQDTQWAAGNISFAWRASTGSQTASPASRTGNWACALILKEIQLQQMNIVIAGVLLALQLSCLAALQIYPHFSRDTIFALKSVWIISILMPLLIGSSAIAEERRLGILETQLCLPTSRTAQWFAKMSVTLLLSLLFGGLIPFVITWLGGADSSTRMPIAVFVLYPITISLISSYASSLVRSTLLAIGTAMGVLTALWSGGAAIVTWNFGRLSPGYNVNDQPGGIAVIILFLGLPVLLVVLARLTYSNFKWLHEESKLWRRNAMTVAATVVSMGILTNAIYFRAWEYLAPIEPAPGPARLEQTTGLKFGSANTVFALTPDGRIWSQRLAYEDVSNLWLQTTVLIPNTNSSRFIGGSNWADVAMDNLQLLGIQSDGTLWNMQRQWDPSRRSWQQATPYTLAQIGSGKDWAQVAGGRNSFMLLKHDGSLWRWGTSGYDWKHVGVSIPKKLALDRATMPSRVGAETDWTALLSSGSVAYAKKRDGSLWQWEQSPDWQTNSESELDLVPVLEANTNGPWSSIALYENNTFAGINTNGELWVFGKTDPAERKHQFMKIRLGENAKWKLCGNVSWDGVWAIRDDGTLWKWPPVWSILRGSLDNSLPNPIQLGSRSDWLSVSDAWQFGLSLAADGGVWAWGQPSRHLWLAPSRKPVYMGNIFEGQP